MSRQPAASVAVALALHPYSQQIFSDSFRSTDLSFMAGSVISDVVTTGEWWEGTFQNSRGSFPANYVSTKVIGRAKCIFNYNGNNHDELTIKKGDDIAIYERRPCGWLRAISNGKGGLIPPSHIREIKNPNIPGQQASFPNRIQMLPGKQASAERLPMLAQKNIRPLPATVGPPPATVGPPPATKGPPPVVGGKMAPKRPLPSSSSPNISRFKQGQKPVPKSGPNSRPLPPVSKAASVAPLSPYRAVPKPKPAAMRARTLYAYSLQHPGDLEFTAGIIIEIIKAEGDWWEGTYQGAKGIFPANYVERI